MVYSRGVHCNLVHLSSDASDNLKEHNPWNSTSAAGCDIQINQPSRLEFVLVSSSCPLARQRERESVSHLTTSFSLLRSSSLAVLPSRTGHSRKAIRLVEHWRSRINSTRNNGRLSSQDQNRWSSNRQDALLQTRSNRKGVL